MVGYQLVMNLRAAAFIVLITAVGGLMTKSWFDSPEAMLMPHWYRIHSLLYSPKAQTLQMEPKIIVQHCKSSGQVDQQNCLH